MHWPPTSLFWLEIHREANSIQANKQEIVRFKEQMSNPRERILSIALQVFAERGFEGATTVEIARRAQVSQPLVHYHFDSKEALWRAAVDQGFAPLRAVYAGAAEEMRDIGTLARLKIMVRRVVRFAAEHQAIVQITIQESVQKSPRLRWLVQTHVGPLQRELAGLLEAGQQEGWAKPLPIAYVLEILLPATVSSFNTAGVSTDFYGMEMHTAEALETHADVLVEIFFQGLVQTAH
jgi:TetR/AcrR family transcriptional regulator